MNSFRDFIGEFSSSWFSVIMGTGVFTTSTYFLGIAMNSHIMIKFARVLTAINFVLFLTILVPFILKISLFPSRIGDDFKNPIKANFYVTFGIAMLSLATNFSIVNYLPSLYISFWFSGSMAVIVIESILMFHAFMEKHIEIEDINPSWFLGTTGLLLIPGTGIFMDDILGAKEIVFFISDFAFGTGFFLYLALFSIWIYRFILHRPMASSRIPLFWINLGPIGAAMTSLMAYHHSQAYFEHASLFFAQLFFGVGVWWFFMAVAVTLYYLHTVRIPYKTLWWSFTFPVGQFLIGTYMLNEELKYHTLEEFAILLYSLLLILWVANMIMMIRCMVRRNLKYVQIVE